MSIVPFLSVYKTSVFPVSISVVARDATTNEDVSDAFVEFHLGELFLTTFTDEFGLAVFTFR